MKLIKLFILLGIATNAFAQTAPSPVGVQLYSFREQFKTDVRGSFKRVKDMGIKEVEVAGFYDLSPKDFKKTLDEFGLKATSMGASFEELEDEKKLAHTIESAKIIGVTYVMCAWIPHVEGDFTLDEAKRAIAVFNKAGKTLADNKLSLLYHPHGYEFRPYKDRYLMDLMLLKTKPAALLVSASCHNEAELLHAQALGLDFVVLSPVKATLSHPEADPLGWQVFAEMAQKTTLPVYALGGMTLTDLPVALSFGARGVALQRGLTSLN